MAMDRQRGGRDSYPHYARTDKAVYSTIMSPLDTISINIGCRTPLALDRASGSFVLEEIRDTHPSFTDS